MAMYHDVLEENYRGEGLDKIVARVRQTPSDVFYAQNSALQESGSSAFVTQISYD